MPDDARRDPERLATRVSDLEETLHGLEALVEALQDAVHRQARRYDHELAELRARIEPAQMARDLSTDARRRGL